MKPLLIFPKNNNHVRAKGEPKPIPSVTGPTAGRQKERLSPLFSKVESEFAFELASSPDGFQPERVLVLETIGSTENFAKACKLIDGLNFLFDFQDKENDANLDFYIEDDLGIPTDRKLKNFVYLTMTNKAALDELIKYFEKYTNNPNEKFPRGLAPLKNLFKHLSTLRLWNTEDRLRTTGIIGDWLERQADGVESIPVEIELWFDSSKEIRQHRESVVNKILSDIGGQVLSRCAISEIAYHALLAEIPISSVETLLSENKTDVELFRCGDIMYFHPTGQCVVDECEPGEFDSEDITEVQVSEGRQPIAALLDGWPLENHQWLKNHLLADDPDGWSDEYKPDEQIHGTAMASLIIHGDKNAGHNPINSPLYVRPIMKPLTPSMYSDLRVERIPEDILPIDIIHRSIHRLFEGDGTEPPVGPQVKVINLSVADQNRVFDRKISPWARLLDWAAWKYQVVFVVSAGNHTNSFPLDLTTADFESLSNEEKERLVINAVHDQQASRRLMSPAESLNAITVGALHTDNHSGPLSSGQIDPFHTPNMPSPINTVSWGARRSVKPDLLVSGGRQIYKNVNKYVASNPVLLAVDTRTAVPPGHKVASPGSVGGLNKFAFTVGTSNAAALTTRKLIQLNDVIDALYLSEHGHLLDQNFKGVLLKALLVHGTANDESYEKLQELLEQKGVKKNVLRSMAARYFGYGHLEERRIEGCEDYQATILQCGTLSNDEQVTYKFPLPQGLAAITAERRFIVTLAWFSPCSAIHDRYRQTRLFFEPTDFRSKLELDERLNDHTMVRNGTLQHEILTGDNAAVYATGDTLNITIKCMTNLDVQDIDIPYGIVVTLDNVNAKIPIYDEIKIAIDQHISSNVEVQI